jgi:hypothetical protein
VLTKVPGIKFIRCRAPNTLIAKLRSVYPEKDNQKIIPVVFGSFLLLFVDEMSNQISCPFLVMALVSELSTRELF